MTYIFENILAIIAATIAAFAFGAGWYMVLSKPWMDAAGLTEDQIKGPTGKPSPVPLIISFIAEFWMAIILTVVLIVAGADTATFTTALASAFIIWVGFILPTTIINHRYQMLPWSLTFIDAGHWLGVLLIQATVLKLIGINMPIPA